MIGGRAGRRLAAALIAASLVLAACTGVPDSSAPSTVGPVQLGNADGAAQPKQGAGARSIVTSYLADNSLPPSERASPRAFLTQAARIGWSPDKFVTVIDGLQLSTFDAATGTVTVTGQVLGTLDQSGVYTSVLPTGDTKPTSFPFVLKKVDGQYRIDHLPVPGLLISEQQFLDNFQQHVVYFYDLAQQYLVPDLRWSAIRTTDVDAMSTWLVDQLIGGPRQGLQGIVSSESTFPAQPEPNQGQVSLRGSTMRVEIPGSSQLRPPVLDRLAAQLAYTLNDELSGDTLEITDGGRPVSVPGAGGPLLTKDVFLQAAGPAPPAPALYYVDGGRVVAGDTGKPVSGALGDGAADIDTIAVAHPQTGQSLAVAATKVLSSDTRRLYVGTQSAGLQATSVSGALSRPCWAPGRSEVWIGDGTKLERVVVSGTSAHSSVVPLTSVLGQRVMAVRLSPDGSQIALVLDSQGASTLWIGAIGRQGPTVRVGALTQISPLGINILDAGWSNSQKLIAIGYQPSASDAADVFETYVDGSFWNPTGIDNMPEGATSIAVSNYGAWAESDGQVWVENGTLWSSPSASGSAYGSSPAYAV